MSTHHPRTRWRNGLKVGGEPLWDVWVKAQTAKGFTDAKAILDDTIKMLKEYKYPRVVKVNDLKKIIGALYGKIEGRDRLFLNAVGMVALTLMMLLTAADCHRSQIIQFSHNRALTNLSSFMMVFTIGLGLAYVGIEKGHINIDLILMRLSRRVKAILGIVTDFVAVVIIGNCYLADLHIHNNASQDQTFSHPY